MTKDKELQLLREVKKCAHEVWLDATDRGETMDWQTRREYKDWKRLRLAMKAVNEAREESKTKKKGKA